MDVYISSENLNKLSQKMGVNVKIVKGLALHSSCQFFYSQTGETLQVKWVMPIGIGSTKKHFGLQFCPCCLSEDGDKPYYRKHWRLAFFTSCLFHSVQMHDRCPKCHSQISLKRLQKFPDDLIYRPLNIVYCSKCHFDLRKALVTFPSQDELEINRINFKQYCCGYGQAGNQYFQYSNLYFEGIRRLLSFLICSPKGKRLFSHLKNLIELHQPHEKVVLNKHSEPELMTIWQRRTGLLMIYYLLQDWPHKFISACKKSKISTFQIYSPYLIFPYWTYDTVRFSIRVLPAVVSKAEHQAIKDYFSKRLDRKIKSYETIRLVDKFFLGRDPKRSLPQSRSTSLVEDTD